MRQDLLLHAVYSLALALAGALLFGSPVKGLVFAAGLGVIKEIYDAMSPWHEFDVADLAANGAGLAVAAAFLWGWG